MLKLSRRKQAILDCIRTYVLKNGYPPTIREIGKEVGLMSSSTVHQHLRSLEMSGHIQRDETKTRSIKVLSKTSEISPSLFCVLGMQPIDEIKIKLSDRGMTDALEIIEQVLREHKFRSQSLSEICIECGCHIHRDCQCTEWKSQYFDWTSHQQRNYDEYMLELSQRSEAN